MEFKDRLAKLRRMKGFTQAGLAKEIGVTTRSIQNYELGSRLPRTDTIEKLADVLDIDKNALLSDEEYFIIEASEKHGARGKSAAERLIQNANALFAGGDISEEDKANVLEALQEAYWRAKIINKKYTPKKYRKDNTDEENSEE